MAVPTFKTEETRLKDFIEAVSQATIKQGEILMRETATPPTILTEAFKMFRPLLYNTLVELKVAPHMLALFRVIRDCAEEVRAKESPDRRLSNSSLFVIMMAVSECIGYSGGSALFLDTVVAKLNGWFLVNKPDGTRVWEEGAP
jgi:hypothetical protein